MKVQCKTVGIYVGVHIHNARVHESLKAHVHVIILFQLHIRVICGRVLGKRQRLIGKVRLFVALYYSEEYE